MTIEDLKQPYEPEGVYAGMTQAEALRYLAKRYLRKPECVALCNEVANNLPKLLKVVEAAEEVVIAEGAGFEAAYNGGDLTLAADRMTDAVEDLRKALEELNDA